MSTHDMIVDPLIKGLPPNIFKGHVFKMGVLESLVSYLRGDYVFLILFYFSSGLILSFSLNKFNSAYWIKACIS